MFASSRSIRRSVALVVTAFVVFASLLVGLSTPASAEERPLLRLGSSGELVVTLEQRLVALGFDPGTVDSEFDRSTRSAVISFQRAAKIGADGLVGPVTWANLDKGVTAPDPGPARTPIRLLSRRGGCCGWVRPVSRW